MSTKRKEPWRNNERHYCKVCNMWMGSDRQSILIHENGKKHRENVENSIMKRREDKLREEKEAKDMQRTLKLMEDAAGKKILEDVATFSFRQGGGDWIGQGSDTSVMEQRSEIGLTLNVGGEMKSWQEKKEKRRKIQGGKGNIGEDVSSNSQDENSRMRIQLGPDEGHYQIGNVTYLDKDVFGYIRTGHAGANLDRF